MPCGTVLREKEEGVAEEALAQNASASQDVFEYYYETQESITRRSSS